MPVLLPFIPAIASVAAAGIGAWAANSAAQTQAGAAQNALNTQQSMYNTTRGDLAPYRNIGTSALGDIASLYGYGTPATGDAPAAPGAPAASNIPPQYANSSPEVIAWLRQQGVIPPEAAPVAPGPAPAPGGSTVPTGQPDYSRFTDSPDYQFALDQGLLAVDRASAAAGHFNSGARTKDTLAFAEGLAAQQYGNYFNRLMAVAGLGANAAAGSGNLGASFASSIGNAQQNVGAAQASGPVGIANALSTLPQNLLYAQMLQGGSSGYTSSPGTGTPINWSGQPVSGLYSPGVGQYGVVSGV